MSSTGRLIADTAVSELLDALAARTPAPGGGTAAAFAAASAASLVEMAASFTLGRDDHSHVHGRMSDVAARAGRLRAQLIALAERELHAFEPVLDAIRIPSEDPERDARVARALSDAAESPLGIARAAAEVAGLGAEVAADGTPRLVGDAVTAALLAESACVAAGRLVEINLAGLSAAGPRLEEVSALVGAAASGRARALEAERS
jgi:methenyltetrahydrofolate cyclohydrolase